MTQDPTQTPDDAASAQDVTELTPDEQSEVLSDEHLETWNNGPSAEQVPESLRERTDTEDAPPADPEG